MPNKYYLREDRKAVKPEMNEPEWPGFYESDPTVIQYYEHKQLLWLDQIKSLPALDVDPDYLKRLSPGWFEGEGRYEVYEYGRRWVVVDKDKYDSYGEQYRRLTIVAPQEDIWKPLDEDLATEKGQEGDRYAKLKQKMREFFDSVTPEELIEKFEKMGYTFVPIPATPQPVTGEAVDKLKNFTIPMASLEYALDKMNKKSLPEFEETATDEEKWFLNEISKAYSQGAEDFADVEYKEDHKRLVREMDEALNGKEGMAKQASLCDLVGQVKAQAASRPSDAVEFANSLLLDGHIQMVEQAANYTIEQLYHLFLNSKSPNPNK